MMSRNLTFQTRKCVLSLLFSETSLQGHEFSYMWISLINEYTIEHFPVGSWTSDKINYITKNPQTLLNLVLWG